jgi:phosphoglycerate kinase
MSVPFGSLSLAKAGENIPSIDNIDFFNFNVILRVDWNVPTNGSVITDDNRICESLPTIRKILNDGCKRIVIISHFGRPNVSKISKLGLQELPNVSKISLQELPKSVTEKYSWSNYLEKIQTYFDDPIYFLKDGLSLSTLDTLEKTNYRLYLLENIRFHDVETNYQSYPEDNNERKIIQQLGDVYVNDAFGCMHRDHLSICGIRKQKKAVGYLVEKELAALKLLTDSKGVKKLAIIGGGKMDDKLPLLEKLSTKMDAIYICGGNINSILKNDLSEFINQISSNRAKIYYMCDGLCSQNLNAIPEYCINRDLSKDKYFFDAGMNSLFELDELIQQSDLIFWNGTLGVVENNLYKQGSSVLIDRLNKASINGKKVIVGGGDTGGFVNRFNHNFYYITTGGGATLEYICNDTLVGLEFLKACINS